MTVEEEAHWSYQLDILTSWGYFQKRVVSPFDIPPEVAWLTEQARYKTHLANAQARRRAENG